VKAAVVDRFDHPPAMATFEDPLAEGGELLVTVTASALSPLVKGLASGRHYSSSRVLPFVAGVDGVGRLATGERVYFASPRSPFGAMAALAPVRHDRCVPIPDEVDDATAAAIANPAMSSWAALSRRAKLTRGQSVLINGATGVAGRLAIQIAKYFGAKTVIATGRNPAVLETLSALGADVVIRLESSEHDAIERFRREIDTHDVRVILDYLWGASAQQLLAAIGGEHRDGPPPIRFVQIGSISGSTIALEGGYLRGSGLELLGSGIGSVSSADLVACVGEALQAVVPGGLRITTQARPLEDVGNVWNRESGDERIVFTL
jgi:NADPH:quinone reductase-like Zn-dependent oxidoreductase